MSTDIALPVLDLGPALTAGARRPRVNLLPPEIRERQMLRRLQTGLAAGVVAAVALASLGYLQARSSVSTAQGNLAAAQAQTALLRVRVAQKASVRATFAEVDVARGLLTQAAGDEVLFSHFLTDLSLTIPQGVWVTSLSASEKPPTAVPAAGTAAPNPNSPNPTVAAASGYGTINFTGVAETRDEVANWLESLAAETGYAAPYATDISESVIGSTVVYKFSSSVVLSPKALSGRAHQLLEP